MEKLKERLSYLEEVAQSPGAMMEKYRKQGKKIAGVFPIYVPEEIAHAAGMVPMGLWGAYLTPVLAGKYFPAFTCSIMRSCMELAMTGKYKGLSCVMLSGICDTFRGTSQAWRYAIDSIPMINLMHPQNRESAGALEYLVAEYETVKRSVEQIAGHEITDQALNHSIEVYNEHSAAMRAFCAEANEHLDVVTPTVRHSVMKSAWFMEKSEHTAIVKEITAELRRLPPCEWTGLKVVLTGITAEPAAYLEILEKNHMAVVGDDLAQESRQYRTDIPAGNAPLERLAGQWFDRKGCSIVCEKSRSREQMLKELLRENHADGLIFCLMRFCDIEEYEYPLLEKAMIAEGIQCVTIDIDQSTQDNEQTRTKIQTFAALLEK